MTDQFKGISSSSAAKKVLMTGHPDHNREVIPNTFSDAGIDLIKNADTVFKASAILINTFICKWRKKF